MKALCIAHRGCHLECYENTLEAFVAASKGDFYGIEMDIHLTKDKKWIIHHDPDFFSNGEKIYIKGEKRENLINLKIDNEWGYDACCPTLEQYLDCVKDSGKRPIIEIKPKNPTIFHLLKVIKEVKKRFSLNDVTFIAFYPWPLLKLKILFPKLEVQLLIENTHLFLLDWAYKLRWGIDVESYNLNQEIVDRFHKKNLKVNCWTVDDLNELHRLEKLGVDFVTTNKLNQNS